MFIFELCLLLLVFGVCLSADKFDFGQKAFSIKSTVSSYNLDEAIVYKAQTYESYSPELKRARIDVNQIVSGDDDGFGQQSRKTKSFYFSLYDETTVLVSENDCQKSSLAEVYRLLKIELPQEDKSYFKDDVIVGPAKLLPFIQRHGDKMKLKTLEKPALVRNIPCICYSYEFSAMGQGTIELLVYYTEISMNTKDDSYAPPMQVMITAEKSKLITIVEFSLMETFNYADSSIESRGIGIHHESVSFNRWTTRALSGCSSYIAGQDAKIVPDAATRFSFSAKISASAHDYLGSKEQEFHVAYDSNLESMAVHKYLNSGEFFPEKTIFNFKFNRAYNMIMDPKLNFDLAKLAETLQEATSHSNLFQCFVSSIKEASFSVNSPSILQILTGADRFVHLGPAFVRGVEASVFEVVSDSLKLPFWLDQPVWYSQDGTHKVREPNSGTRVAARAKSYVTLVYAAQRAGGLHPLLIEIYAKQVDNLPFVRLHAIEIFDFMWDFDSQELDEERPGNLFSLGDFCSSKSSDNKYAKVDLQLESQEQIIEKTVALFTKHRRELALLAAMQSELELPATMVNDLETYLRKANNQKQMSSQVMQVSFRVAEHAKSDVDLIFLGAGRIKQDLESDEYRYGLTFSDCFRWAGHQKADVYFAYSPQTRTCMLDSEPISKAEKSNKVGGKSRFDFMGNQMEIYQLTHSTEASDWIADYHATKHRKLIGSRISLPSLNNGKAISFKINQFHIDTRDVRTTALIGDDNTRQMVPNDKIPSFGLDKVGNGNREITSDMIEHPSWSNEAQKKPEVTEMTYSQCQAACLADFTCQSFSLCIRSGQVECVISGKSLRSQKALKQISAARKKSMSMNSRLKVALDDDSSVDLIYNPRCDSYNKIYLHLFETRKVSNTFTNRLVFLVNDDEECAEICFNKAIEVFKSEATIGQMMHSPLGNVAQDYDNFSDLLASHRNNTRHMCRSFLYVDIAELDETTQARIAQQVVGAREPLDQTGSSGGYCVINERSGPKERDALDKAGKRPSSRANDYLQVDRYDLRGDIFFEKVPGVRLGISEMDERQLAGLSELNKNITFQLPQAIHSSVLAFVARSGNNQISRFADESRCARICFFQTFGPWPACKSFDLAVEKEESKFGLVRCHLNSITLKEAYESGQNEIIDSDTGEWQISHYEPRKGFILNELAAASKIAIADEQMQRLHPQGYRVETLGLFCIVILCLALGTLLGIKLGEKLLDRHFDGRRTSVVNLMESRPSVSFTNQVDDEGNIRD